MNKILICDDEQDILNALNIYLTSQGYATLRCENGRQALDALRADPEISLVLLDIMMPVMDGITALAELRSFSNVPVILLSAKSEDTDKILGLDVGADDYITKPFVATEVLARVRSQLRRYTRLGGMNRAEAADLSENAAELLTCGPIVMDDRSKTVTLDGEAVSLTPKEYDILHLLLEHVGRVYSMEELYRAVWKEQPLGSEGTVAVHIRHLREKLEIDPANPRYLQVVWGQGYKLCGPKHENLFPAD